MSDDFASPTPATPAATAARPSWGDTLRVYLEPATLRMLAKYDVPFADYMRQDELTLNHLLERQLPPAVDASFADATAAIVARMEAVTAAAAIVDACRQLGLLPWLHGVTDAETAR